MWRQPYGVPPKSIMSVHPPLVDLRQTLQAASQLDVPEAFRIKVRDCILPISGQYGLLPRLLFYLLLCFSLMVRSHEWLAVGALAATMTYSGTVAVHIMLASFLSPASAADDLPPMKAILSTACIMAVPLFNWSTTLRRLRARPLIIYWDVLIVTAYLSSCFGNLSYYMPELLSSIRPQLRDILCELDPGPPASLPPILYRQWLTAHSCNNPCDLVAHNIPFRSGDSTYALVFLGNNPAAPAWFSVTPQLERLLDLWILPILVLQGYYSCLVGRSSPAQLRNQLFLTICCRGRGETWLNTTQNFTAKYLAIMVYMLSMAMLVISPAVCIANLVLRELYSLQAPWVLESESPTMVGQWSPWVTVGLALLGAVIARYHDTWMEFLQSSFKTFSLRLLGWTAKYAPRLSLNVPNIHQVLRYLRPSMSTLRRTSALSALASVLHVRLSVMGREALSNAWLYLLSPLLKTPCYLRTKSKGLRHYLLSPLFSITRCLTDEWRDFIAWLRDPYYVEDTLILAAPMDLESLGPRRMTNGENTDGAGANSQDDVFR